MFIFFLFGFSFTNIHNSRGRENLEVSVVVVPIVSFYFIYLFIYLFDLWEKAAKCFAKHQQTRCHNSADSYYVAITKCKDIGEITNDSLVSVSEKERIYLM